MAGSPYLLVELINCRLSTLSRKIAHTMGIHGTASTVKLLLAAADIIRTCSFAHADFAIDVRAAPRRRSMRSSGSAGSTLPRQATC
jgi:hypothetical protein